METLFAWIHLSDVQLGHGSQGDAHDQKMVLRWLHEDIRRVLDDEGLQPDAVMVTGDIAWAGKPEQYADARAWLAEVASAAGLPPTHVYTVPGNHDVLHDPKDRHAVRLVRALRSGDESLDDAFDDDSDNLVRRQQPYLDFAAGLAPACGALFWTDHLDGRGGLRVRLVGLNTALLSEEKDDRGKLRLGKKQLAHALDGAKDELIVVLSHHPLSGGWLADEKDADRWIRSGAHLHLFGHVKDAGSQEARTGAGGDFVRVAARAAHQSQGSDHGYAIGAVVVLDDGSLAVRLWPQQWDDKNKRFVRDVGNTPRGATYAEHPLRPFARPALAPVRGPQVSIARLPATGPDLFGREKELAWLDACWNDGVHVAVIVAWGGVGKSALVNTWLARLRDKGWDGAARVYGWSFYSQGTDRLTSSDEFVDAALRWFGDPHPTQGSAWDKGERLAGLVRKERALLVLDGVEPLQWRPGGEEGKLKDPALAALVKELGAHNKGLCIITTRIAVADLDSLRGDKVQSRLLDHLSPEAGAVLLKARGAKGAEDELREAAREYKGHGLALTLLGSYLADVADGDIRRRKEIGPLEEEERQGGHARRVMEAYELWLGRREVGILHMIGLFDRPADEDEIDALRKDPVIPQLTDALVGVERREWNRAVMKLRRVGLLAAQQNNKLDAHPLVREHFEETLRRKQPEAWREGHRRLYEHLKKAKPLPETIEEMAPLYAAVVHGCQAGKNQEALEEVYWERILRGDEHFNWKVLGAFGSELTFLSAFFDPPWERLSPGLHEQDQAFVMNQAGLMLRTLGRLSEAARLLQQSLEQRIAANLWSRAAKVALNLVEVLWARGELSKALTQARTNRELAGQSGDAFMCMASTAALAAALHAVGLREESAAQFHEAERMQKEIDQGHPWLYSQQGFWYCDLLLDQNRDADVRERASQALGIAEHNRWILAIGLDHVALGRAYLLGAHRGTGGDLAQAKAHLRQAVETFRTSGQQDELPRGLLARAALHTHTHAFDDARRDLDEALTIAERCGFRLHEADAHLGHARLALAEGRAGDAREHLERARAIVDATGYHRRDEELVELGRALG